MPSMRISPRPGRWQLDSKVTPVRICIYIIIYYIMQFCFSKDLFQQRCMAGAETHEPARVGFHSVQPRLGLGSTSRLDSRLSEEAGREGDLRASACDASTFQRWPGAFG